MNQTPEMNDQALPTIAGLYVLAQISAWKVLRWRQRTHRRPAMVLLDNPRKSSLNPRVVGMLIDAGLVEESSGTLIVSPAGVKVLDDRPDFLVRMRETGAI